MRHYAAKLGRKKEKMASKKKAQAPIEGKPTAWEDPKYTDAYLAKNFKGVPDFVRRSNYFKAYLHFTDGGKKPREIRPKDIWALVGVSRERGWSLLNRMVNLGLAQVPENNDDPLLRGLRLLVPISKTAYAIKKG